MLQSYERIGDRKMRCLWTSALLMVVVGTAPVNAYAESSFKAFFPFDASSFYCDRWMRLRSDHGAAAEEAWALGFASGISLFWGTGSADERKLKAEKLLESMDERCREYPRGYMTDVVITVMQNLGRTSPTQPPKTR